MLDCSNMPEPYLYAPISATNSATVFLTTSSVNSNSAATRFAAAERAIVCGLEMGGSVGKGGGDSQVAPSTMLAGGENPLEEYGCGRLEYEGGLSVK
jgi:hypothetical protein